jgi:predicted ArsR family transcriptional regulator
MRMDKSALAVLSGLGDPVRRRLYEYVAGCSRPVARDDAARAAGIGRPLAAYHLDKLVRLGLLTASYQRPPGRGGPGAGRPAKVYARARTEFAVSVPPRDYELLARLLAEAVESDPDGAAVAALLRSARRFGTELGHRAERTPGASPRQLMLAALREHGFEPGEDPRGPVVLHNCPFHQLAASHPAVVCGMNLALIDGLAAGLGAGESRPVLDPGPDRCCVVIGGGPGGDDAPNHGAEPSTTGVS